jgi:hypothetical protein
MAVLSIMLLLKTVSMCCELAQQIAVAAEADVDAELHHLDEMVEARD